MRIRLSFVALCTLLLPLASRIPCQGAEKTSIFAFTDALSLSQRALEERFDRALEKDNLKTWMKRITAKPHHLGSPSGKEVAEFVASQFRSWGYETTIEKFDVLFPTPKVRIVEMLSPTKFTARLSEPQQPGDATSAIVENQLPTFHAYSSDGDVTAQLVYVNHGIPEDYETLNQRGIDVKDKIVIARYGGSWRGIKPKVAAEHGAIGCLIYSDPHEDGYFRGDVYPKGAWRNENSAQRGSVADMPVMAGDPLTPGVGATSDAKRLTVKEATTLTKIPVLPLSYSDALPLLKALQGPIAPDAWRGALPITYHLGPGPATVHLKAEFSWNLATAHDVIATLKGSQWPDEWVIRGNHHDAWNFGAADPVSGLVALMEEARGLSEMVKTGWHPRRTIIYAAWDGEEQGLLGSTEWVETHASTLDRNAVAYVNSDSNGRGFLSLAGSHSLETFANEVSHDVIDPEKKIPVFDRLRASLLVEGTAETRNEVRQRRDLRIEALGSGSDYTPFLQHLGIASLNLSYGGEGGGGSYHSIYDSFDHYTRFEDTTFAYGISLAQTAGRMVLRLANAEILPFGFESAADTLNHYLKELVKLADSLREQTEEKNRQLEDGSLQAFFDPAEPYVLPKPTPSVPYLNFAPIQNALLKVSENAGKWTQALHEQVRSGRTLPAERLQVLNRILIDSERTLIQDAGLPRRPWFRHQVYAPGFYTGYSVKTLPGVREAIEQKNSPEMEAQSQVLAKTLESFATQIQRAVEVLKEAK